MKNHQSPSENDLQAFNVELSARVESEVYLVVRVVAKSEEDAVRIVEAQAHDDGPLFHRIVDDLTEDGVCASDFLVSIDEVNTDVDQDNYDIAIAPESEAVAEFTKEDDATTDI